MKSRLIVFFALLSISLTAQNIQPGQDSTSAPVVMDYNYEFVTGVDAWIKIDGKFQALKIPVRVVKNYGNISISSNSLMGNIHYNLRVNYVGSSAYGQLIYASESNRVGDDPLIFSVYPGRGIVEVSRSGNLVCIYGALPQEDRKPKPKN